MALKTTFNGLVVYMFSITYCTKKNNFRVTNAYDSDGHSLSLYVDFLSERAFESEDGDTKKEETFAAPYLNW